MATKRKAAIKVARRSVARRTAANDGPNHEGRTTTETALPAEELAPEESIVTRCIFPGIDPAFVSSVIVRRQITAAKQHRFAEYRRVDGDFDLGKLLRNRASCEDELLRVAGGGRYKLEARDHDGQVVSAVACAIEGAPKTPGTSSAGPGLVHETPTGIITLANASPDTNAVIALAQQMAQESRKDAQFTVQHMTETYKAALATVAAQGATSNGQEMVREVQTNMQRLREENQRLQTDNSRLTAENAGLQIKLAQQSGPMVRLLEKIGDKGIDGLPKVLELVASLLGSDVEAEKARIAELQKRQLEATAASAAATNPPAQA